MSQIEFAKCNLTAYRDGTLVVEGDYRQALARVITAVRHIDTIRPSASAAQITITESDQGKPLSNVRFYKLYAGRLESTGKITERYCPEGTSTITEAAKDIAYLEQSRPGIQSYWRDDKMMEIINGKTVEMTLNAKSSTGGTIRRNPPKSSGSRRWKTPLLSLQA